MIKILNVIISVFIAFWMIVPVAAHQPSDITLNYDKEQKNLHVEAQHVTNNSRKHFIRRLRVYKNDIKIKTLAYVQQTNASIFADDVLLDVATGDVLEIEAICSQAGREKVSLVIE